MNPKIVIIGAGPGGYAAALRASKLGADVYIIEKENIGGTCLNRGCIPSKTFKKTAKTFEQLSKLSEFGISLNANPSCNMSDVLARKEKIIQIQANGMSTQLKNNKIQYIKGHAYIKKQGLIIVNIDSRNQIEIEYDKLILATGTIPKTLKGFPFDGDTIMSSTHALCLTTIPKSIMIVGAGFIGSEFAFIFNALGSKIFIVEQMSRILEIPGVDKDSSKFLQREMKKRKITFLQNHTIDNIQKLDKKAIVTISSLSDTNKKQNQQKSIEVDNVLICIGNTPCLSDIGLENLRIKTDNQGWIIANNKMETNIPNVYAIGDILGPSKTMLAHVASAEGKVAACNAVAKEAIMDYTAIPWAVFTIPEVAGIGLSEQQALDQGYNIKTQVIPFRSIGMAHVIGEIEGQAKIIFDLKTKKILGVHIGGAYASELIAEACALIQMKATIKDLENTIHTHPTLSEIMWQLSEI